MESNLLIKPWSEINCSAGDFLSWSLEWGRNFEVFFLGNSNNFQDNNSTFHGIIGAGSRKVIKGDYGSCFDALKKQFSNDPDWYFGYFGYDIKNEIENLKSQNPDRIGFDHFFFFVPEIVILVTAISIEIHSVTPEKILKEILSNKQQTTINNQQSTFNKQQTTIYQNITHSEYIQNVKRIQNEIIEGNVYELNYCIEFFKESFKTDPYQLYYWLNEKSPMPFSCFARFYDKYLISASPERFLKKSKNRLLSQPMKGTISRNVDPILDFQNKESLYHSEKERAENMMIVDLVRNDLARSSIPGSVYVEEMFGIYSFPQLHQMVSTISSVIKPEIHFIDSIKNAFPMGSMTGAPKISAMKLIDHYEKSARGLFSGAVGYITPDGDFDFSVVIRSVFYNSTTKYLSFFAGSAITYDSDPEKEYEECMLKTVAIRELLSQG